MEISDQRRSCCISRELGEREREGGELVEEIGESKSESEKREGIELN